MAILIFFCTAIALWLYSEHLARVSGPQPASLYWFALALACVGFALYGLRERSRLLYGLLELVIGGTILLGALNSFTAIRGREFVPIVGGGIFRRPPEGWLQWNTSSAAVLSVAAAIYIIVRGLDNVGEGLQQLHNPIWARIWRSTFPRYVKPPTSLTIDKESSPQTTPADHNVEIMKADSKDTLSEP